MRMTSCIKRIVMPANAGIQCFKIWIPAFAGMTALGAVRHNHGFLLTGASRLASRASSHVPFCFFNMVKV